MTDEVTTGAGHCPFCGKKASIAKADEWWFGRCSNDKCDASGPRLLTKEAALKAWNRRAITWGRAFEELDSAAAINEQRLAQQAMMDREIKSCRVCHRPIMATSPDDIHPWCIPAPKAEALWGTAMRNALSPHQREQALLGFCPFCERPIRGWRLPVEGLPPELYKAMREQWGIDPRTGHAETCPEKGVTIGG